MSVVNFAKETGDNRRWTPKQALEDAIEEYNEEPFDAVLIVKLRKGEGYFNADYTQSNLKGSETVALCEVVKAKMIKLMGYI